MPKKTSSAIMKWVFLLVVLVVLVVGSIFGTLFLANKFDIDLGLSALAPSASAQAESPKEEAPSPSPIFVPLEPFTVTLKTETRNRILYTGITVRVQNESSRTILLDYMPEVRDRILRLLATQNSDYIQTPDGRAALVAALSAELQKPFTPMPRGPQISDVLFTAFVIQ